jgi:hypothetical protein
MDDKILEFIVWLVGEDKETIERLYYHWELFHRGKS